MDTVMVPKSLLAKFSWDGRKQEYFALIPKDRLDGTVSYTRFRVEFPPEGGFLLILQ